jgi:hypothetical protein
VARHHHVIAGDTETEVDEEGAPLCGIIRGESVERAEGGTEAVEPLQCVIDLSGCTHCHKLGLRAGPGLPLGPGGSSCHDGGNAFEAVAADRQCGYHWTLSHKGL